MGLTSDSVSKKVLNSNIVNTSNFDFKIAIAGNPNVGKSTIFNSLTGLHQHTGNWPGKTVSNASGIVKYNNKNFLLVDIPGTYSILSNSEEEEIARDYICFEKPDVTVVVVDATCLERNLNLVFQVMEITENVILCVNLLDEAEKKGILVDLDKLSAFLGIPVVGTIARKKKTLFSLLNSIYTLCTNKLSSSPNFVKYDNIIESSIEKVEKTLPDIYLKRWISLKLLDNDSKIVSKIKENFNIPSLTITTVNECKNDLNKNGIPENFIKSKIISSIMKQSEFVSHEVTTYSDSNYLKKQKIDKILTSKKYGIPIMILFLCFIFWLTITGANYPSQLLSDLFSWLQVKLLHFLNFMRIPSWLVSVLVYGLYQTVTWVISVMLPPMAIFFPLFTILEDLGYLPRLAFNLDNCFRKSGTSGKQALTMCMGFGCNAAGVVGCRIIDSPRERLIGILTNSFVPCNGRFPFLITISSIFIAGVYNGFLGSLLSTISVLLVVLLGIFLTLILSKILSKTILKGLPSSFVLELPPYRKPQILKTIIRSIFDRTLYVLGRAISVAAPAGIIIWIFSNIHIGSLSILEYIANFLNPFANLLGLDGYILTAFILGFPANEIVLPLILMGYLKSGTMVDIDNITTISQILIQNGWTILTAINVMIFTLLHFPCSTTILTIKKETNSLKWTILSFLLPTICGIILCMFTTFVYNIII